ncbi:hypothetical protein MKW98_024457 [Papaver atlanticum]|uniref:Uncharacterized protein n=1 Tax=Papaver atlanticum TaxID=357466 RepID=A0AAD4T0E0_9MAGN|nr:hypothetical protein MKW98_024457 [Papaver atlanticum]
MYLTPMLFVFCCCKFICYNSGLTKWRVLSSKPLSERATLFLGSVGLLGEYCPRGFKHRDFAANKGCRMHFEPFQDFRDSSSYNFLRPPITNELEETTLSEEAYLYVWLEVYCEKRRNCCLMLIVRGILLYLLITIHVDYNTLTRVPKMRGRSLYASKNWILQVSTHPFQIGCREGVAGGIVGHEYGYCKIGFVEGDTEVELHSRSAYEEGRNHWQISMP